MTLHVDDDSAADIRFAAGTMLALADSLRAGGVDDTFVTTIREKARDLLGLVGEDQFFRQVLADSKRHLPGRTLAAVED